MLIARAAAAFGVALAMGLSAAAAQSPAPSIDDLLNLKRVGSPVISPDGSAVAYTLRETNWDDNEYETEIWIGTAAGPRRLTNGRKSSQQPAWSPDGNWLAFISDRDGKRQIYRIAIAGGEAEKLTDGDEGVNAFRWSPDGQSMAFTMTEPVSESVKEREQRFGDLRIEDEDQRMAHIHLIAVPAASGGPLPTPRVLTRGSFVVGAFDWSPDGRYIAFDHRISSDPADGGSADISTVEVTTATSRVIVGQAGPDSNPRWAPDGTRIAFVTAMRKPFNYYLNSAIAIVDLGSMAIRTLSEAFDENPQLVDWTQDGIFFSASQRTWSYLFKLNAQTRQISRVAVADEWIGSSFSITGDGRRAAFIGSGPQDFADVFLGRVGLVGRVEDVTRITTTADQIAAWPKHAREIVRWKSQDGTEIEGVLHKPSDFQPGRRYPLLIVIHGGPTGVSRPLPYSNGVGYYPIDLWLAKGTLVLEPNYRGSAGYGERFRSLNVRNLGIGDAWDVLSGIDHLVNAGMADRDRVGAMGWSQGGYISAFLTTRHSDRFKAVSVGAGISNWMTYYVNTDIHPFTRQYLQATPWDDARIYADTSPMTYIKSARTPTLIQHGDQDARVPVPNAFELYQGLRDQRVTTQLVLFKGFGHPLNKPKANRAAMQQNLEWFNKYLWPVPGATQ
ncbi:MAG TPA: S9 family peptidase [Vicinamibacterales bacterium]|nr:S9 family peptidase [Vicinamibacterales bacterium]